ncbi:ABC transporter ATP-binding protein [Paenibacillus sp. SEL1]|uniref:ABC transporter ATP-binding protein n=1 Tax=Paenibacillus polymyxa TaxID=1406 RepID=A0AAE9L7T0_PAEPO|nr:MULTISPECIES: ABC transporter ATP-binding protein [Paenibacillus]MCP3807861.1 ABC transporter ATP-binding protein [Paenibacillus sp. Lou8.1]URJ50052.1 ABC transporter ATP-binding protein [Paenibacillus polymyxa]
MSSTVQELLSPNPVISVNNVSKIYKLYEKNTDRLVEAVVPMKGKRHKEFYALKNLSLTINKGECIGILGKNGAGKSTLLKMITGVLKPSEGDILVDGKIAALLELGAGFNPELTGLENIYFNGRIMGFSKDEMDLRLEDILSFADIDDFIHQPVKTYSSGMFARLAFAVAINVDPDILIIDEALSVGDVAFQTKCFRRINEFIDQGKTIIFVTHSMDTILKYCNRAAVIHNGENVAEGTPKEMVDVYKKILVNLYDISEELKVNKQTSLAEVGEWKKSFSVNKTLLEYGDKLAEIIDFGIFDLDGIPSSKIISDEPVVIKMKVRFHAQLEQPIFAFTVKDLKGNEICGTNTMFENILTPDIKPDEEIIVTFTQSFKLQSGYYTLSLGCTGFQSDELVVYHRLYDVLSFEASIFKNIVGLYDLESQIQLFKNENRG